MATNIIMPALEMAQETGVLVAWLKREGESVTKGEPLITVETDKVTVEIAATASGILGGILVQEGGQVPVGQTVGWLLAPGESVPSAAPANAPMARSSNSPLPPKETQGSNVALRYGLIEASPLARKIAQENGLDLASIKPFGKRIEKSDVLSAMQAREQAVAPQAGDTGRARTGTIDINRRVMASPKARRLAVELEMDLALIDGTGPDGAVLAADVITSHDTGRGRARSGTITAAPDLTAPGAAALRPYGESVGTMWKVMAERMSASWTTVPHFYLTREVQASALIDWRKKAAPTVEKRTGVKLTYTDLLVKIIAHALKNHPRLNSSWAGNNPAQPARGEIVRNEDVNIGIATALDDGLIVPVIRNCESLSEIATQRKDLIERAQAHRLNLADIAGGTFTLSNLGMYNVDAFNAIVNAPQAAILAVGRIADRVIALEGQAVVRPMMVLTLSCDHRVVDGARGAKFLDELASLIEDPWGLLA